VPHGRITHARWPAAAPPARRPRALRLALAALTLATSTTGAAAQNHAHAPPADAPPTGALLHLGASATGLLTRAAPALAGRTFTEGYLTQPVLTAAASLAGGRLSATGMLNLEGLTLRRGELTAGMWGEGYVDRRHPHTYLHELVLSGRAPVAGGSASLSVGRGFAPFGTDDPMARPFVKFPLNHHLAQLPERVLASAAWARGPVVAEAGLFTGAEPRSPEDVGGLDGFGRSWAARLTALPRPGIELQVSTARVAADQRIRGIALDHRKHSASARASVPLLGGAAYGLAEWARTSEHEEGRRVYTFESVLGEAALRRGAWGGALRFERSTRPEEERLSDPFRTPYPHADAHLVGVTRWLVVSGRAEHNRGVGPLRATPFVEASWQTVAELTGSIYDPVEQYGRADQWHLSVGLTLGAGMRHARMGRYGAARTEGHAHAP